MNYHDQKIQWTLARDIQKHWTAVSTLLGLISSVCCDLHHWRLNQRPQNAELKLYHRAINPHCTQVMPNQLVMVIAWPITWMCLASYICTLYRGHSHLQGHILPGGLEIRIHVIIMTSRKEYRCTFSFIIRGIILWIKLWWPENLANNNKVETAVQCFSMLHESVCRIFWSW